MDRDNQYYRDSNRPAHREEYALRSERMGQNIRQKPAENPTHNSTAPYKSKQTLRFFACENEIRERPNLCDSQHAKNPDPDVNNWIKPCGSFKTRDRPE